VVKRLEVKLAEGNFFEQVKDKVKLEGKISPFQQVCLQTIRRRGNRLIYEQALTLEEVEVERCLEKGTLLSKKVQASFNFKLTKA